MYITDIIWRKRGEKFLAVPGIDFHKVSLDIFPVNLLPTLKVSLRPLGELRLFDIRLFSESFLFFL